ncbi:MAG: decarboxylating NADP(+)-dependent phosphogluconate dehydrogenase [Bacteroidales bacterium]|nr:decarboxylating NADP(+)-dependent phosphogluconate dehydrogenase [Bacteroidales bacterium]
MNNLCDIGLVGLGVMGASLARNMESRGFRVGVFNYIPSVTAEFLEGPGKGKNFYGADSYTSLVASLSVPRKVFLMVTAGKAVDAVLSELVPLLSPGDVVIDGGNSDFHDTRRRYEQLSGKGIHFVGCGVSGGEEGALKGPAMMPGGSSAAWPLVRPLFQSISARAADGAPCCDWIGPDGSGHFVKMVHNGIEYGDIELICECYQLMRDCLGMSNPEMQETFARWNEGELGSYLIGITAQILGKMEPSGEKFLLDSVLDTAGQKGTGKWTVEAALDEGVPLTLIGEAVFARCLSARKEERVHASAVLSGPAACHFDRSGAEWKNLLSSALLAAKIVSYAQGFDLLRAASEEYGWQLDCGRIARLWRGGCIIRSVFLDTIHNAFSEQPELKNLMLSPWFRNTLARAQDGWRKVVCMAVSCGIPVPALSSALSYYDGYRCARSGANLLQAQRDFFGAHTYERTDRPRGEFFHTRW